MSSWSKSSHKKKANDSGNSRRSSSGGISVLPKKTQNKISLYQFAISEVYRGQGLLKKMFKTINDLPIVALCPTDSDFNEYYYKTGWNLQEQSDGFKIWVFSNPN